MRTLTTSDIQEVSPQIIDEITELKSRHIREGSRIYYRTLERAADGLFYVWVTDERHILKLKGFRLKKKAKAWRDGLAVKRRMALNNVRVAAKARAKPAPDKVTTLLQKIAREEASMKRIGSKIKSLNTRLKTHARRLNYYRKQSAKENEVA